jgi:hypothetical protein
MAAAANAAVQTAITIPPIDVRTMQITVVGESPLISHRWSEKAKKEMLDKQMKKAKTAKVAKDPQADYEASLYKLDGGAFGFPAVAFKAAAVGACRFSDGIKMTEARGAFHVVGEFVTIEGTPTMREDMVRVGMGVADIRLPGRVQNVETTLTISYNASVFSARADREPLQPRRLRRRRRRVAAGERRIVWALSRRDGSGHESGVGDWASRGKAGLGWAGCAGHGWARRGMASSGEVVQGRRSKAGLG